MPSINVRIITRPHTHPPPTMTFYVHSGVAIRTGQSNSAIFSTPSHIGQIPLPNPLLTPAEYNAINWNSTALVFIYANDFLACVFTNSMHLSDRLPAVSRVYFSKHATHNTLVARLQARLRQSVALTLYNRAVDRRTAVAMALHARLGGDSGLRLLGQDLMANHICATMRQ